MSLVSKTENEYSCHISKIK